MGILRLLHGIARQIGGQDPNTGNDVTQVGDSVNNAIRVNKVAGMTEVVQGVAAQGASGAAVNPILPGAIDQSGNLQPKPTNQDMIVLASAARTSSAAVATPAQTNLFWRSAIITLNISALNSSGTGWNFNIQGQDLASGNWYNIATSGSATVTVNTPYAFVVGLGATGAGSKDGSNTLPKTWRATVQAPDGTNANTYSVSASLNL